MRSLIWFRNDLRVADNTALHHACRRADDGVVAAFAVCPTQWRDAHDWGAAKVEFVLRCVAALSEDLADLNVPLRIVRAERFDELPDKMLELTKRHECDSLFANYEYEVYEQRRDERTAKAFEDAGRTFHLYHDQTIIRPDLLKTGAGRYYKVYTPFRKSWMEEVKGRDIRALPRPKKQKPLDVSPSHVPRRIKGFEPSRVAPDLWPGGEAEARKRLRRFTRERIDDYHKDRDYPALDATSRLSAYLAHGAVSARQCLLAAREANNGRIERGREGPATWIGELAWREFYRHVLVGFPRVSMNQPFRRNTDKLGWNEDEEKLGRWCEGRTGVPLVDAAMRQMNEIGWMHNRLRMAAAMYLVKDLWIDWRLGERYFMNRLVDGDLANNNGGWQWSASTGTDAVPYFRIFNPFRQAARFDPEGRFIRRWCPELADLETRYVHDPRKLPPLQRHRVDYPEPMVDHKQARERAIAAFKRLNQS